MRNSLVYHVCFFRPSSEYYSNDNQSVSRQLFTVQFFILSTMKTCIETIRRYWKYAHLEVSPTFRILWLKNHLHTSHTLINSIHIMQRSWIFNRDAKSQLRSAHAQEKRHFASILTRPKQIWNANQSFAQCTLFALFVIAILLQENKV